MRALFLATSFLAALSACGPTRPPWAEGAMVRTVRPEGSEPQDLSRLEERLVALHNRERSMVGASPLAWDPGLAAAAAAYGPEFERLGRLRHSPPATRRGQGENLWLGTAGAYSLEEMVGSWAAEKRLFEAGAFPQVSRSGHWSDVAHYTQMI